MAAKRPQTPPAPPYDPGLAAHLADYPDPNGEDLPPLPAGFALDAQPTTQATPPLPAGFTLDTPSMAPQSRAQMAKQTLSDYQGSTKGIGDLLKSLAYNFTIGPFEQAGQMFGQPFEEHRQALANMSGNERAAYLAQSKMTPIEKLMAPPGTYSDAELMAANEPLFNLGLLGALGSKSVGGVPTGPGTGFFRRTPETPPPPPPRPMRALPPAPPYETLMGEFEALPQAEQRRLNNLRPEVTVPPRVPSATERTASFDRLQAQIDAEQATQQAAAGEQRALLNQGPPPSTLVKGRVPQGPPPLDVSLSTEKPGRLLAEQRAAAEGRLPVPPGVMRPGKAVSAAPVEPSPPSPVAATTVPVEPPALSSPRAEGTKSLAKVPPPLEPPLAPEVTLGTEQIKQPWEMTKQEWYDATAAKLAPDNAGLKAQGFSGDVTPNMSAHYNQVKNAIERGGPVPPEVLAEYPDLVNRSAEPFPTSVTGEPTQLHAGIPIPPKLKEWAKRNIGALGRATTQAAGSTPPEPTNLLDRAALVEQQLRDLRQPRTPPPPIPPTGQMAGAGAQSPGIPPPPAPAPGVSPTPSSRSVNFWNGITAFATRQRAKLPSELRLLKEAPESAAISSVEGAKATVANGAHTLVQTPWAKSLRKYTPSQFSQLENQAVHIWEQGGKTSASLDQAIQAMPRDIQTMLRYRQSRLPIEQASRKILGLPEIPETQGPYFPRMTEQGLKDIQSIARGGGSLASDLQTTVKSFQQSRFFRTMAEGEAQGMKYKDPRAAWAMREWHSLQLEATADLMQNLEQQGVLFRTAAAAKAASPTGRAFGIENLPGATQWFAGTNAEREFVIQNLSKMDRGSLGGLVGLGNQLLRNPNLFNPAPHFLKNMLYKFTMSGGNPAKVPAAMAEYERGVSPLVQRFKAVFPAGETAQSPGQLFDPFLRPDSLIAKGERAIGSINKPSSAVIFEHGDPGLRYARWKQYKADGMSDQAAANHVQVDLIRYGTRSDAVDFWKSIPLNFFVPWRTGTVTSVVKQMRSHPIRTIAFIGAIDYIREARYRATGQTTHLPIDYLESPISQLISHPTPKTIAALAATTRLFGPGGAATTSTLTDALSDIRGGDEWGRVMNMFWGISQLYNIPKEFQAFQKTGEIGHLVNIFTSAAVAEHSALNYKPRRLAEYIPESFPFMRKSDTVRQAEAIQQRRQRMGEKIRERRAIHPRRTIEEILQVAP